MFSRFKVIGAPEPFVIADENFVVLAYYMEDHSHPWNGTPRIISPIDSNEPIAIVRFDAHNHMFGPPNDEAFSGHPLARRGLTPYGAFQIEHSSWIRQLERMNSVHPQSPSRGILEAATSCVHLSRLDVRVHV